MKWSRNIPTKTRLIHIPTHPDGALIAVEFKTRSICSKYETNILYFYYYTNKIGEKMDVVRIRVAISLTILIIVLAIGKISNNAKKRAFLLKK